MAAITRLVHRRTFKELMSSKETTSSRSLPEDMAAPTRCMTLETCLIDNRFYGWPLFTCPLAHHSIGSLKCGVKTRSIGLYNLLMAGSAKTYNFLRRRPLPLMCHLLSPFFVISAMTFDATEPPMDSLQKCRLHISHLIRFPDPGKRGGSCLSFFGRWLGKLCDHLFHLPYIRMTAHTLIHILFSMKGIFDERDG